MPFIFKNASKASLVIPIAALAAAAVQCILLREYLAVFSGNELTIGIFFCFWLCATGLGSLLAAHHSRAGNLAAASALLCVLAVGALLCIRALRLLFSAGQLMGPLEVVGLCAAGETPFAFVNGYVFGSLCAGQARNPYGLESLGSLFGSLIVYACVLVYAPNAVILLVALLPFLLILRTNIVPALIALGAVAALLAFNTQSLHWKYPFSFSKVIYGREGEIVKVVRGSDTTYLLNGSVYKATADLSFVEQAVHIPLTMVRSPRAALVIFDRGHVAQLGKYPGLSVDCIELESAIASGGCVSVAPETFRADKRYDVILLGAGLPQSAASNRFYTVSFFRRMKSIMIDGGIFSFTLPLSENYLAPPEQRLYATLRNTLARVFNTVLVFPGNGYTFMASDFPLKPLFKPRVRTTYLETAIVPSVSSERIAYANQKPIHGPINTAQRPLALAFELMLWLDQFKASALLIAGGIISLIIASMLLLPKTIETASMATSGFTAGAYSVALLLLYQSTFGLLYSRLSLFLVSLTCGFVVGTLVKNLRHLNALIGGYCLASLGLLSFAAAAPALLFFCCHAGMGILVGAQFRSLKATHSGVLFAADLFGGALGMFLCSTLLVPLFGIVRVAVALCLLKCCVWFIEKGRRHATAAIHIFKP